MAGAPRLCAPLRSLYALRQAVKILIDIGHMEILLHAVADAFAELRFHLALDDEHHVAEARAPCVKQGKINDDMSFRIDRLDLPKRLPMPAANMTSVIFSILVSFEKNHAPISVNRRVYV